MLNRGQLATDQTFVHYTLGLEGVASPLSLLISATDFAALQSRLCAEAKVSVASSPKGDVRASSHSRGICRLLAPVESDVTPDATCDLFLCASLRALCLLYIITRP